MDQNQLRAAVTDPADPRTYHAIMFAEQDRNLDAAIVAARRACLLAPSRRQLRENLLRLLRRAARWPELVCAVPRSPRSLPPRQSFPVDLDGAVARHGWLMNRMLERANEDWTPSSIEASKLRSPLTREQLAQFRLSEVSGGTQTHPDRPNWFRPLDFSRFYPPLDDTERAAAASVLQVQHAGLLSRLFLRRAPGIDYYDAAVIDDDRFGDRCVVLPGIGRVTGKSLQSAYYACRIASLVPRGGTVLEIGGGFGALASRLLAIRPDVTCVLSDLPVNMVLTHTYLSSLYGGAVAGLWEERDLPAPGQRILVVPPWRLTGLPISVDLTVNTMSFQHMDARNHAFYGTAMRRLGTKVLYHLNRNVFRGTDSLQDTMAVPADEYGFMADFEVIERHPFDDLWMEVVARARG